MENWSQEEDFFQGVTIGTIIQKMSVENIDCFFDKLLEEENYHTNYVLRNRNQILEIQKIKKKDFK